MIGNYKVITLCGSTRFKEEFLQVQKELTLQGNIVISVGLFGHAGDFEVWENMSEGTLTKTKEMLDDDTFRLLKLFHIADKYRINVPSEEVWSPIPNTDELYYVSNYGNVKRNNKILKKYIQKSGHCRITISIKNKQKRFLIHRLVAQAFIPNPNNYKQVGHFDGNPLNNNVFNLYWCNQKQNINNEISRLKISSSKNKEKNPMFGNHKSRNRNKKV